MKFPVLLIFDDGSLKVIKSENELNEDVDWSLCNSTGEDIFISEDLDVGRRLWSDEDRVWKLLGSQDKYSEVLSDEICWGKVMQQIQNAINTNSLSKDEMKVVNPVLKNIKSQKCS